MLQLKDIKELLQLPFARKFNVDKKIKALVIKGEAGLGNRLRPMLAALAFADKYDIPVYVDWRDGMYAAHLENAFPLVFELKNIHQLYQIPLAKKVYPSNWTPHYQQDIATMMKDTKTDYEARRCHLNLYPIEAQDADVLVYWNFYFDKRAMYKLLILENEFDLFQKYLKPTKTLKNIIAQIPDYSQFIGVHFRATDMGGMGYINKFFEAIDQSPNQAIILCTDNLIAQKMFVKRYGKRIHFNEKIFAPNNAPLHRFNELMDRERILLESLKDMYTLAKVNTLIRTQTSTFSHLSAYILGLPNKVINI